MERARDDIALARAHTDASFDAEPANDDAVTHRLASRAQRVLDDLIEHDRIVADEQLLKFRESADSLLLEERAASPVRDSLVAEERRAADEGRMAERQVTDALLMQERGRADAVVDAERSEQDRSRAQAENEQTRRRDVLAMVTHDLRTPLSVLAMNAQHIAEVTEDQSVREAAEDMTRSAARMARLLTDLLDVVRIESGTLRVVRRPHDLCALVHEVLRSYRPLFASRGMTLTAEVPVNALVASFDHDRIVQVLSNLLGNAMKFTPAAGTVDLRVASEHGTLELTLRDSGIGIRPSALPHIFERFWQRDGDQRRGLGLGLYICDRIVHAHDGTISAESVLGEGTTFRLTLPAA